MSILKRVVFMIVLTAVLLVAGIGSSCDSASCTITGLTPGEQVQVSYRNSAGQVVDLVGYADANGSIQAQGCQEVLASFQ